METTVNDELDYYENLCVMVRQLHSDAEKIKEFYDEFIGQLDKKDKASETAINKAKQLYSDVEKDISTLHKFSESRKIFEEKIGELDSRVGAIERKLTGLNGTSNNKKHEIRVGQKVWWINSKGEKSFGKIESVNDDNFRIRTDNDQIYDYSKCHIDTDIFRV